MFPATGSIGRLRPSLPRISNRVMKYFAPDIFRLLTMPTVTEIIATLQRHWATQNTDEAPTQFPGAPLDAAQLTSWYEFWTTELHEHPSREAHPHRIALVVDVHCFSRRHNKRHILEMADRVRGQLARRNLPVSSPHAPETRTGLIRIREPVIRDLTRDDPLQRQLPLQHVVVSLQAIAENEPDPP